MHFAPHPRPAERQEAAIVPVLPIDEEEAGDHHEHPHHQVDDVQHVVEAHRVLHPEGHDHSHQEGDQQGQQVRVRLLALAFRKVGEEESVGGASVLRLSQRISDNYVLVNKKIHSI